MDMDYGIQMYSLRDTTEQDMEGSLRAVADMGYKLVEFAGFGGNPAEKVAEWLDTYGLTCHSTHTGHAWVVQDLEGCVRYHKTIGCDYLIVPGFGHDTREKVEDFIAFCNEYQPRLAKEGIRLGYHNHSHEFLPTPYGMMIHEEIERRTKVDFQIDTFWAFNAGLDPLAVLDRLQDRIRCIHLKDGFKGGEGRSLGLGEAPVAAVRQKAIELGFTMIVESEGCEPTGAEEARRCIGYLRSLEK